MLYDAKNGTLAIGGKTMDYISFGNGKQPLVILTGVGDGLKTVKGMALPFAHMYRTYAFNHKVYVFSRVNELSRGYTTKDMAQDVKLAMDALELPMAAVMGISQGGMIAQFLALDFPASVEKLVLVVSSSRPNPLLCDVIPAWIDMAKNGDYRHIMADCDERSYSDKYLRKHRTALSLSRLIGKPKDFTRFIIQAASCLSHDAFSRLPEIACPALIIGGGDDRVLGPDASKEIAAQVQGSDLHIYEGLRHAVYDEAPDFNRRVLDFLK